MKNQAQWHPTKFVRTPRGLRASRNPTDVAIGSRIIVDIVATYYERAIRAHATGRLLDMGCGHVPLYDTYRDLVSENICIDWENTLHVNPYLDQTVDLNQQLPFADASFDTILLTDVLEHIAEPMNVMRETERLLRPGGKLILGVPFLYWLHEQPHDFYRYTEHALRRFCKLSGLKVIELEPYGGLPEVILDLTSKGLEDVARPVRLLLRPIHTFVSVLCGHLPGRKHWSRWVFPLGYVVTAQKPVD